MENEIANTFDAVQRKDIVISTKQNINHVTIMMTCLLKGTSEYMKDIKIRSLRRCERVQNEDY